MSDKQRYFIQSYFMDKNSTTGFLLIMLILLGWYVFFNPSGKPKTPPVEAKTHEVVIKDSVDKTVAQNTNKDSVAGILYGDLGKLSIGEPKTYVVKTDKMEVTFQGKGGVIEHLTLQDHKDQNEKPLPIVTPHKDNRFVEEFVFQNRGIRTDDLYFTPVGQLPASVAGKDSAVITFQAKIDSSRIIEKIYVLKGGKYDLRYYFRMVGLQNDLKNSFYGMEWKSVLPVTEKAQDPQRQKSTIVYNMSDGVSKMGAKASDEEAPSGSVKWIAYRAQFFSQTLIADNGFHKGSFKFNTPEADTNINKIMESKLSVDFTKSNDIKTGFTVYAGPLEFNTLKSYGMELHKQMDLGWGPVKYINQAAIWVFKKLESLNISYGLIILIFGILIKLVVFPMTYKSFMSMAKLKVLNQMPEMKEIDEKYKEDPQKLQMEKMGIYNKMGVSPFGGCIPMLLQYPIIISMFFFFPQAVELRHQSFLWATDLSSYDSILTLPFSIPAYGSHVSLFTILMALSTFLYTYYNQSSQPGSDNPAMKMQMTIIMYIMPFFLLFFLNNYASGLSWYYFVSNLLAISQTQIFRYFIDDKKLEMQLIEATHTRTKNGKAKGRMQTWIENQQKKQKEMTEQQKKSQATNRRDRRS